MLLQFFDIIINMKILLVTDLYPINNENITKALYLFVREWQKQGHTTEVIRSNFIINTLIRGRKITEEKIYYENGIKIYNLNFHTPFLFNVYKKLPADFSLKNYDVIISHMPSGALMANRLLEKEKIKYICAVHASDIVVFKDIKYSVYFKNQLKKAYETADKIAVRSPVLKSKIEEILPYAKEKTFIAFSGIDEKFISAEKTIKNIDKNNLRIITTAALIKRKNINLIIEALAKFNHKNFHYTIIGEGKERKRLEKLAKKYNISNNITFTGKINNNHVIDLLRQADIFIMVSKDETFGLSYLEAAASGNIILAKKDDGLDGFLTNGENAFFVYPNSKEILNCLNKIYNMNNKELNKIRTNAIEIMRKYTTLSAAENYLKNIN